MLDFASVRSLVRILIGPRQTEEVRDLVRLRSRPGFEVRVCTDLHLKIAIFDSLFLMLGSANLTSLSVARPDEAFSTIVDEAESESVFQQFFKVWHAEGQFVMDAHELIRAHEDLRV